MTLWAAPSTLWIRDGDSGTDLAAGVATDPRRWTTTAPRWTTSGLLTSTESLSSTIHRAYYSHCQNLYL